MNAPTEYQRSQEEKRNLLMASIPEGTVYYITSIRLYEELGKPGSGIRMFNSAILEFPEYKEYEDKGDLQYIQCKEKKEDGRPDDAHIRTRLYEANGLKPLVRINYFRRRALERYLCDVFNIKRENSFSVEETIQALADLVDLKKKFELLASSTNRAIDQIRTDIKVLMDGMSQLNVNTNVKTMTAPPVNTELPPVPRPEVDLTEEKASKARGVPETRCRDLAPDETSGIAKHPLICILEWIGLASTPTPSGQKRFYQIRPDKLQHLLKMHFWAKVTVQGKTDKSVRIEHPCFQDLAVNYIDVPFRKSKYAEELVGKKDTQQKFMM